MKITTRNIDKEVIAKFEEITPDPSISAAHNRKAARSIFAQEIAFVSALPKTEVEVNKGDTVVLWIIGDHDFGTSKHPDCERRIKLKKGIVASVSEKRITLVDRRYADIKHLEGITKK